MRKKSCAEETLIFYIPDKGVLQHGRIEGVASWIIFLIALLWEARRAKL